MVIDVSKEQYNALERVLNIPVPLLLCNVVRKYGMHAAEYFILQYKIYIEAERKLSFIHIT